MEKVPTYNGGDGTNMKKEISIHIEKAPSGSDCQLIIKQGPPFERDMQDSRLVQGTATINSASGISITTPCTVNIPKCVTTRATGPWTETVPTEEKPRGKSPVTTVPSSSSPHHMRPFLHAPYCHSVPCKEKIAGDNFAVSKKHMSSSERNTDTDNADVDKSLGLEDTNDRYYEGIKTGVLNQLPTSTRLKTRCDVAVLLGYLRKSPRNETRDIEEIPPQELDIYLAGFFKSIKKTNGEDYHSVTMPSFMGSFNRYLKILNYPFSMFTSCLFHNTRRAMEERRSELAEAGFGKRISHILSLEDSDIDILKDRKVFGVNHPVPLLNFIFYSNCINFRIKKVTDHYRLLWSNFKLRTNSKGREYLVLERQGSSGQNTRVRVYAKPAQQALCPVSLYKEYRERRPILCVPEFYLVPIALPRFNKYTPVWFRSARMGKNAVAGIMNKLHSQGSSLHAASSTSAERPTPIAETSSLKSDTSTATTLEEEKSNGCSKPKDHITLGDVFLKEIDGNWRSHSPKDNQMKPAQNDRFLSHDDSLQILGISSSENDNYRKDSSKVLFHNRPIIISSVSSDQEQSKTSLISNPLETDKCSLQPKPFTERPQRVTKSVKRKQPLDVERESKVMRTNLDESGYLLSSMNISPSSTSDENPQHRREKHISELCPYTGRFLLSSTAMVNTLSEKRTMLACYESPTSHGLSQTPGCSTSDSELPPHPVSLISVKGFQENRHVAQTTRYSPKQLADFTHEVSATWAYQDIKEHAPSMDATTPTSLSQVCNSRANNHNATGLASVDSRFPADKSASSDIIHMPKTKEIVEYSSNASELKGTSPLFRPTGKHCSSENNIFTIMSNARTNDTVDTYYPLHDSSFNTAFSPMKLATKTVIQSLSGSQSEKNQNQKDTQGETLPVIVSVRSLAGTGNCSVKGNGDVNLLTGTANSEQIWNQPEGQEVPRKPSEEIAKEDEQEMLTLQTFSSHIYCLPDQNARLPNLVCPSEKDWQTIEEHTNAGYGFPTAPVERRLPEKLSLLAGHSVEKYHRLLLELFPLLSDLQYSLYCRVTDDQHGPLVMVDLHELKKIPPFLFVIPYKHHERKPLPILVSLHTNLRSESPETRGDEEPTSLLKSLVQGSPHQLMKNLQRITNPSKRSGSLAEAAKPKNKAQSDSKHNTSETTNDKGNNATTVVAKQDKVDQEHLKDRVTSEASIPVIKTEDVTRHLTSKSTNDKEGNRNCVFTLDYSPSKLIEYMIKQQDNKVAPASAESNISSTFVNRVTSPLNSKDLKQFQTKEVEVKRKSPLGTSNIRHEDILQTYHEQLQDKQNYKDKPTPFQYFKAEEFTHTSDGAHVLVEAKAALQVPESHVHCEVLQIRTDHYLQDVYNFYKTRGPVANYTLITKLKVPDKRYLIQLDTTIMFHKFWQLAVKLWFKGNKEFVPILSPSFDSDCFTVLGTILAHGLVHCSYWPVHISKACAVSIFTESQCSQQRFTSSFLNCIPDKDSRAIEAMTSNPSVGSSWNAVNSKTCEQVLTRYGYTDTLTPSTIDAAIHRVSETHQLHQPYFALGLMGRVLRDIIKTRVIVERDVVDLYAQVQPEVASIQRHADMFFYKHGHL